MNTAIVYYSRHHGNTERLLKAIAGKHDVTLINVTEQRDADLSAYDRVGFASGIYYSSFAKQVLDFARKKLPANKQVFFLATCGAPRKNYFDAIRQIARERQCIEIGTYLCLGFDTYGPLKLIGGLAKGHPTDDEIAGAVSFYEGLNR